MSWKIQLTSEAMRNSVSMIDWIGARSVAGARSWNNARKAALDLIERQPFAFAIAPENKYASVELRNCLFSTPKGRIYRIVYYVDGTNIIITHIRGPGQQSIPKNHLP